MGALDADGFLTLKDRSKDLIISGGSNIYPREVEEVLLTAPGVAEVAVVGAPDAEWGEVVVAFVVGLSGTPPDVAALDAHCLAQMARFKRPKRYVLVPKLPKNNYGKVLKTELRQRLLRRGEDGGWLLSRDLNRVSLGELHEQLREGQMDKRYVALLSGRLTGSQHRVEAPLLKTEGPGGEAVVRVSREGKQAITVFTVLERFRDATLVEARLLTGRTHQIRVHAQHLGHPLVGDGKYGRDADNSRFKARGLSRLFLHARDLRLTLPSGKKLALHAEPDEDFQRGLEVLRRG